MKNAFRYIAAFFSFSAATLLLGENVFAQNLPDNVYLEEDGICFRKTATQDDGNPSVYHIDLESFVKGSVIYTEAADSSDIVLVLDVSGSMTSNITSYSEATVSEITYDDYGQSSTGYYYKYQNDYYAVYVGRSGNYGNRRYYLYFTANNRTLYINSEGNVVTTSPTDVSDRYANLLASSVQLYSRTTITKSRLEALQDASKAFITAVAKNAKYDKRGLLRDKPLNHRIAIVKFAGYDGGDITYYNNDASAYQEADGGNHYENVSTQVSSTGIANYTEVVRGLKSVLTDSTSLKNAIDGLRAGGATAADHGMVLAKNIINSIDASHKSNKTVVFFTDGAPTHQSSFNSTVASTAINNAHDIKTITYGSGDNATHPNIFSVGVFSRTPSTTQDSDIYYFMNYISSNYPNATGMTNAGSQTSTDFYKNASGGAADLTAIFQAIANSASTPGNTIGTSSAVTVDVVTNSVTVPANAEDAELEVLIAPCVGTVEATYDGVTKEYLTFGDPVNPADVPTIGSITATIDPNTNTVSTTGFNYSANFCGLNEETQEYQGWKQIIRFIITVNDDAVGGPSVNTNDKASGIYIPDPDNPGKMKKLAEFNRPTVKIPVQIWIQKAGLQGEDSAVFNIRRTPFVENFDPDTAVWDKNWGTKIVIGPEDYDPVTGLYLKKQVGLDPDYYYKVYEDAWAFGYTYQLNDTLYTFGDEVQNPFTFSNTPNNKKFDETFARNVFKERGQDNPLEPEEEEGGDEGGEE